MASLLGCDAFSSPFIYLITQYHNTKVYNSRGAQILRATSPAALYSVLLCHMSVGPQYGTYFVSPVGRLEVLDGF